MVEVSTRGRMLAACVKLLEQSELTLGRCGEKRQEAHKASVARFPFPGSTDVNGDSINIRYAKGSLK